MACLGEVFVMVELSRHNAALSSHALAHILLLSTRTARQSRLQEFISSIIIQLLLCMLKEI